MTDIKMFNIDHEVMLHNIKIKEKEKTRSLIIMIIGIIFSPIFFFKIVPKIAMLPWEHEKNYLKALLLVALIYFIGFLITTMILMFSTLFRGIKKWKLADLNSIQSFSYQLENWFNDKDFKDIEATLYFDRETRYIGEDIDIYRLDVRTIIDDSVYNNSWFFSNKSIKIYKRKREDISIEVQPNIIVIEGIIKNVKEVEDTEFKEKRGSYES